MPGYRKKKTTSTRRSSRRRARTPRRNSIQVLNKYGEKTVGGAGDYRTTMRKHAPTAGAILGALTALAMGGGATGAGLGARAGGALGRVIGHGDYTMGSAPKYNSLFQGSKGATGKQAMMASFGNRSTRVQHREYLGDLVSSSTAGLFQLLTFALNPGVSSTFPWLSPIAGQFTTYQWHGVLFEFVSTSADALNSTNTALGTVTLVADYNASSGNFVSKQDMLNSSGAIDTKPSMSCICGIECDTSRLPLKRLYVRSTANPNNGDLRFSDICTLNVATQGFQGTSVNCGELYITYDVEFFEPILEPPGANQLQAVWNILGGTTAPTSTNFVASINSIPGLVSGQSGSSANYSDNIGCVWVQTGNFCACRFPSITAGMTLSIDIEVVGTSCTLTQPTPNVGGSPYGPVLVGTAGWFAPSASATTTSWFASYMIAMPSTVAWGTAVGNWPTFSFGMASASLPTSPSIYGVRVRQINGNSSFQLTSMSPNI